MAGVAGRRKLILGAAAAAAGAAGIAAWRLWPEQGLWNPCLARLPQRLAAHELVRSAWAGLDPLKVWDAHAHLIGAGDSPSGVYVNPRLESLLSPQHYARRVFFLNAGCAHDPPGNVDRAYVARLRNLLDAMPRGVKLLLFAFERTHRADGSPDLERTSFHVPDAYARDTARSAPDRFEWVASIHPYRADAVEALEAAARDGARAVKWLPNAMEMDPASPRCDRFYAALARLGLPLVAHVGHEGAVLADRQELGNPLRLRRALDAGVRVVAAHCASRGQDQDLDRGANAPLVESFELFARLMDEPRYAGRLFGDLSAMTQINRAAPALARVIERSDWHARLLNGSDYPLPGVMPIFSLEHLVQLGLLDPAAVPVLGEIRRHNPLLFDFVLKRQLRSGGRALPATVFETRAFFDRP